MRDWPRRAWRVRLAPPLPSPAHLAVTQADDFVQRHRLDHTVGAEMSEALPHLAPCDQHAARLGIAKDHRPPNPLGFLASRGPVAEPQFATLANRRSEA